ncbi:uncharacterized protein LOC135502510 [Lineus longissimus]|uniref:uncharacterized protein LOC135502510 n=1 Tax=Lineus longissimus TaxID=88925 RepID=UPI002B4F6F22
MEWFWIFAFTMAAVCLVGGLVWSILWRKRENRALLEALILHEEDLASRRASRRLSEISQATTQEVGVRPSATPSASSCQSLPSTSSKDRLYQANNNEMEMAVMATPTVADDNSVDNGRVTPCDSDWRASPRTTESNTVDTDFTGSVSSRPTSASSGNTSNKGDATEIDNNNWATPAVTFSDATKRGNWKVNRKSRLEADDDSKDAKYKLMQNENYDASRVSGTVRSTDQDPEKGLILNPAQSSDESEDEVSFSTKM